MTKNGGVAGYAEYFCYVLSGKLTSEDGNYLFTAVLEPRRDVEDGTITYAPILDFYSPSISDTILILLFGLGMIYYSSNAILNYFALI